MMLLVLSDPQVAFAASTPKNRCETFDQIALQLALAETNAKAPFNLDKLQSLLGAESAEVASTTTSYSWIHKDRILLVTVNGDNIADKMLSGNNDGSATSKKMELIYSGLKSATSIWSIDKIQSQLGPPGYKKSSKTESYGWHCNGGSLTVTTNENNDLTSATIEYNASPLAIEARAGLKHPAWDTKTDSLGQAYRAWQRSFTN